MSHPDSGRLAVVCVWALSLLAVATPQTQGQWSDPLDPAAVELPVLGRLTGWIFKVSGPEGSAQKFGQSVMPLAAQNGGLPGLMIQHYRADTIARGTYPIEGLFYKGVPGRLPDSSSRVRIGLSEIGAEGRLLCAGDWDGDGYRDLAMWLSLYKDSTYGGWDASTGRVVIFWGNEREEYSLADTSRLIVTTEQWFNAQFATSGDFDTDLIDDLLIYGGGSADSNIFVRTAILHMFRGSSMRRWGRAGHTRWPDWSVWNPPYTERLAVIDQNDDSAVDIVFYNDRFQQSAKVSVLYGRHGALPDTSDIETVDLAVANGHYSLFSDVTGDGVPELLVNTGSTELIRIYAGAPGQRLKEQYGSGYEGPTPGKGFWRRPWAEVWLPMKINDSWYPAGWGPLLDLGDANDDGINDIWAYAEPNLICYLGGSYLDSLIDAYVVVPGTEWISAAPVGDITGTGRPMLAVGYDWIPSDRSNPFPGGVMFVRTDTSFTTREWNPRRLPVSSSEAPAHVVESAPGLVVYPNPAREGVRVVWDELSAQQVRVSVINVLGVEVVARVLEASAYDAELDLRALPAGRYRVILRTGTSIRSTALTRY